MQARLAKARMLASLQLSNPNATIDDLDMPDYEEPEKNSPIPQTVQTEP
jgi:hypothetical protein